jgi:DNA-binding transcriptional LysR family regulator
VRQTGDDRTAPASLSGRDGRGGSFSRAARILNIKQTTLSRHIPTIERRLGRVLFDRETPGATLTPNGKTYLPIVQRVVKEFTKMNAWYRS